MHSRDHRSSRRSEARGVRGGTAAVLGQPSVKREARSGLKEHSVCLGRKNWRRTSKWEEEELLKGGGENANRIWGMPRCPYRWEAHRK